MDVPRTGNVCFQPVRRVGGEIGGGGGGARLAFEALDEDLWETISQENITGHFPHVVIKPEKLLRAAGQRLVHFSNTAWLAARRVVGRWGTRLGSGTGEQPCRPLLQLK